MSYREARIPDPEKKNGLRSKQPSSRNPGVNGPAAPGRVSSPSSETEEESKPTGEYRRPITNHDEENRIVNSDQDGAIDERESEGI